MKTKWMLIACAALLISAAPAMAGHEDGEKGDFRGKMMEKVDTDKDGKISKAEFIASHEQRFVEADTDADGFLSQDEMKAKWEKMHEKRKEHRMGKEDGAAETPAPDAAPAPEATGEGAAE